MYTDGSWRFDPDKFENEGNPKPWEKQRGRQGDRVKRPKQPVLDAHGVPIEIGDIGWLTHLVEPIKVRVEYVLPKGNIMGIRIDKANGLDEHFMTSVEHFTHREPDTQERIEEDATMPPRAYYAENIGHDVGLKDDEEVWTAVTAHLLRRQRELDGRDA